MDLVDCILTALLFVIKRQGTRGGWGLGGGGGDGGSRQLVPKGLQRYSFIH